MSGFDSAVACGGLHHRGRRAGSDHAGAAAEESTKVYAAPVQMRANNGCW